MAQMLEFTCGPAALIELLRLKGLSVKNDLEHQIAFWRIANTVIMGEGPAGCDAIGLARVIAEVGLKPTIYQLHPGFSLARTVRDAEKKEVIAFVERQNAGLAHERGWLKDGSALNDDLAGTVSTEPILMLVQMRAYSASNEFHWIMLSSVAPPRRVYDPMRGYYEMKTRADFFEFAETAPLIDLLSRYGRFIPAIVRAA